jgi:hypothetical protein
VWHCGVDGSAAERAHRIERAEVASVCIYGGVSAWGTSRFIIDGDPLEASHLKMEPAVKSLTFRSHT